MMKRLYLISILSFSLFAQAYAAGDFCEKAFEGEENKVGKLTIVSSGGDGDVLPAYKEQFKLASEIAANLGISVPPHYVEFIPSGQMAALAAVGHYAAPHWYDGKQMASAAGSPGGILEFVHEGCPTCRSFYQDITDAKKQLSVFFHVLGHNDFGVHSVYQKMVPGGDPMLASLELSDFMRDLRFEKDPDEVSQWFQMLISLTYFQDLAYGTYQLPESFVRKTQHEPAEHAEVRDLFGKPLTSKNPYAAVVHPKTPTRNALQFLVENLPESLPEWKVEMAKKFERMVRVYNGRVNTKFMNEGWATLMQYVLPKFMPWKTSSDLVEYAQLLKGVAVPRLDNPYWLGTECWKRIMQRFYDQPEVKALKDEKDKFRAFVKYAHGIKSWAKDYSFIQFALDEAWVTKHNLFLNRPAERSEMGPIEEEPKPGENAQFVVLSRDPKRIVQYIARKTVYRPLNYPSISIVNEAGLGRNVFELKHNVVEDVPLAFRSSVEMLLNLARIQRKPVSLSTVASNTWIPHEPDTYDPYWRSRNNGVDRPEIYPIRIEVAPSGEAKVFSTHLMEDGFKNDEGLHEYLTQKAQDFANIYKFDLESSVNEDLAARDRELFGVNLSSEAVVDAVTDPTNGVISHDPASSEALLEYYKMIKERLLRELGKAARGEVKFKHIKGGVRLKVFPIIPQFRFDHQVSELLRSSVPPAPMDNAARIQMRESSGDAQVFAKDDGSGLGSGDRQPGDRHWGKKPEKGTGEGGDPLDPQRPEKFDGDAMDPSEIDIPLDLWAQMLADQMELPNSRRLAGKSDEVERSRLGTRQHPVGEVQWDKTIVKALEYSVAKRIQEGKPPFSDDIIEQLKEGIAYITPPDHIVPAYDEVPEPNIKAVMFWVIDMTGSMRGKPQDLETEFVTNAELLIGKQYKHVEHVYIGYDDVAHEFSKEDVLTKTLGGGNRDSTGYLLAEKIQKERYPENAWDVYVTGMGDGGSTDTEPTIEAMRRLYKVARYMAFIHTDPHGWHSRWGGFGSTSFLGAIRELSEKKQWFGFGEVDAKPGSVLKTMRKLFGKNNKK